MVSLGLLRAAIVSVALAASLPAAADLESELASCAAIAGELDRLDCFDRLAKGRGLAGPQPVPTNVGDTGKWQVRRDKNPIDDTESVFLRLEADSGASRFGDKIIFVARCQSNETDAYIVWHDFVGDDSGSVYSEWKHVTIRVGTDPAVDEKWSVSTDRQATFAPAWAGDLLKRMVKADRFLAQLIPYGENPVTAIFDTSGMRNALAPLTEVCGWSLD